MIKKIKLVLFVLLMLSLQGKLYAQLTNTQRFGTIRATCKEGFYIDLHNFSVTIKMSNYTYSPGGMFDNDVFVNITTTYVADKYIYDGKGNVAELSIADVRAGAQTEIKNFSIYLGHGSAKIGSLSRNGVPHYTKLTKGRAYEGSLPYEWSEIIGANWKEYLKQFGKNLWLEVAQPDVELTHYMDIKYYFDQLAKKQEETEKLEEQYQEAMKYSTSYDISELNIALGLLNDIIENESASSSLTEKATQEILSIKFHIKFNNLDKKQENSANTNENENSELTSSEEIDEETTIENKNKHSYNDKATRAANSYSTCKELYRRGHFEAAKRCFEGHQAAYSCWDCNEYIRKITEEQLYQSAGKTAEAAAQVWVNFAEKADHFTLNIGYIYSPERGDKGLEMQISPVYEMLYWGLNFTYLEKRQYNFPFMYDDYENTKYWGVGTSAGFHGHLFSVKRKKGKYGKERRLFSIEGRLGYGIYYGWLGSETSFEYYPEAYVSVNNLVGFGIKYISSIDGWANHDDYLGNSTFLDNMGKNKYFKGVRYSLFINFSDIF